MTPHFHPARHLSDLESKAMEREKLLALVRLVATGKRSDGTYNYCREALEQKAKDLLKEIGEVYD